jgi:hypothetical protein
MGEPAPRFLPARLALLLALTATLQGLAACWITGALGTSLPFSGSIPLQMLPHVLCGVAVALSALIAPLAVTPDMKRLTLTQSVFAALFLGAMYQFFVLVCARLVPLDPGGIVLSALCLALFAFSCLMLSDLAPRAYAGIVFLWVIAIPVMAYMTADIFLSGPGSSKGWQPGEGTSPLIYTLVHGALNSSPATAMAAALDGALPDGSYPSSGISIAVFGVISVLLATLRFRVRRAFTATSESQVVQSSASA